MGNLTPQVNNFTAGELSPRLLGRTDIDRYGNAVKTMVNAYPVVQGGCKRRGGTRFTAGTKFNAKHNRLIPFVVSRDNAYQLEFGDSYLRVFKAGGTDLAVELATLYSESMLADLDFTQSADELFVFHPSVPVQRVRRFSDAYFDISAAPFSQTPFAEQGVTPFSALTLSATTVGAGRIATSSGTDFLPSDVGRFLLSKGGLGVVTGYTSSTVLTVTIIIAFPTLVLPLQTWTLSDSPQSTITPSAVGTVGATITISSLVDTFRAGDFGALIKVNNGLVRITQFTDAKHVNAFVIKVLDSAFDAPALSWELQTAMWSALNGYPRTGTIFEQRLVLAGTTRYPQTIWGSKTGDYFDFTNGTADSDGYTFTIASDDVNPISYLVSAKNLLAHTYGGEFSLRGGVEKPITPTNVHIEPETAYGCKSVRPILVGKESLFVQRAGFKIRAMGYDYRFDGFSAPDITVLAEHITKPGGITALAYQQEPDRVIWAVRSDGALLSCTYDRDQQVTGWAKHYTTGAVESVSCIPNGSADETWITVRRTINGATVRYIEIIDDTFEPLLPAAADPLAFPPITPAIVYGYTVDCGKSFDSVAGQSTFAVPHLIGATVDIVADGSVMPTQVVPGSGNVTISRLSNRTLIGMHFRSEVGMLTPEAAGATGTAQGSAMSTSSVTLRFLDTLGAQVYDYDGDLVEEIAFRQFGPAVLDQAPAPFTGLKRVEKLGWEIGQDELSIVQDQPLPMHLLAVIRQWQTNS